MAEISWIKLKTTMFDDEKIRLIQAVPEADAILVIWIRLLVLAGKTNDDGLIYIQRNMPYSEEMLATLFGKNVNTVRLALTTLANFNMIDISNDGVISISNWEKHQNIEGMEQVRLKNAERNRKYRERKKQELLESKSDVSVTSRDATDIDKELDIDKENNKDSRKSRKRIYEVDSPYYKLAKYLYQKINENGSIKEPSFQSWADEFRKMVELDNRTVDQVKKMIDWCQKDSFWNANILFAKKLREKFDVMVRQANRKSTFNNRSKGRIEKLPEHIKNPPKQAEMTAEEEAELNRKLAKYLDKGSD